MMKHFEKFIRCGALAAALLTLGLLLPGCEPLEAPTSGTNRAVTHPAVPHYSGAGSDTINVGDAVTVTFSDLPIVIPPFEERVKNDGSVTLLYSQKFQFAGKNRGDLEAEVRERYVPAYFNNLTVTIKQAERFYFVNGEVRIPNRYVYSGETTVLKALASAGGFTDYAKKSAVRLTRASGQSVTVDCEAALDNSALDLPVYPGDTVNVPRRLW